MTRGASLAWLIQPLSVETFLGEVWATRQHLIKRACPDYFAGLFEVSTIEGFLQFVRPDAAGVQVVRGGDKKDPAQFRQADGAIDVVQIRNWFAQGYTVVLNGLERYVPAIAALAHAVEAELNFETQVNAYITPPRSQGFLPHFDDHDVLVLQVQGAKTWHVYPASTDVPPHLLPYRDEFDAKGLPAPDHLPLEAGDVLYLPRGRVHAAEANELASVHLTFGIHPPTILALASKALEALSLRDDRLLARLPPRAFNDIEAHRTIGAMLREVLAAVDDRVVSEAVGGLEDSLVRRGRCQPTGRLVAEVLDADDVCTETRLAKSQPLYSRVVPVAQGVALQFAQSLVPAGADHQAAMLFLSRNTEQFQVGDIPGLSAAQQVELARKLVLDGFLVRRADA